MPQYASIPSRWMAITGKFTAEPHLFLYAEVVKRGIDIHAYDQVAAVWKELNEKAAEEAAELKARAEARKAEEQIDREHREKLSQTFPDVRKKL